MPAVPRILHNYLEEIKIRPSTFNLSMTVPAKEFAGFYQRIREILELAQARVARTVNTTQVVANWLIGREIVEEE